MKNMFFEWSDSASSWTIDAIRWSVDSTVEFAQAAVEVVAGVITILFMVALAIHIFPLFVVWLAGAPFWVVTALALGF